MEYIVKAEKAEPTCSEISPNLSMWKVTINGIQVGYGSQKECKALEEELKNPDICKLVYDLEIKPKEEYEKKYS